VTYAARASILSRVGIGTIINMITSVVGISPETLAAYTHEREPIRESQWGE